jgi:hypothetical protein
MINRLIERTASRTSWIATVARGRRGIKRLGMSLEATEKETP